jgi:thioredoxin 1
MAKDINESSLRESIENSQKPILIDFYATWCGPCKMSEPLVEKFSEENLEVLDVYKVNVDENQLIAKEYGIKSIPAFVLVHEGEVKNKLIGSPTKEKLEKLISEYKLN